MNIFNHNNVDAEELSFLLNEEKVNYQNFQDNLSNTNLDEVTINFDGIYPPKGSRLSLYSESIGQVIYLGQYQDSITVKVPEILFTKEEGLDVISFALYDTKSNDTYVLMQEKPYIFWKKGTVVNIHFLNEREYYNEDFALFVAYTVTLTNTKK